MLFIFYYSGSYDRYRKWTIIMIKIFVAFCLYFPTVFRYSVIPTKRRIMRIKIFKPGKEIERCGDERKKTESKEANSPINRVLVAFVDIGYRRCCSRGCRRENVLGWLRRRRWILGMCRSHTSEVWTVMETWYTSGAPVRIVQPCATSATSALEVTPVQPAVVILKTPESEKKKLVRIIDRMYSPIHTYICVNIRICIYVNA